MYALANNRTLLEMRLAILASARALNLHTNCGEGTKTQAFSTRFAMFDIELALLSGINTISMLQTRRYHPSGFLSTIMITSAIVFLGPFCRKVTSTLQFVAVAFVFFIR